jgi:hypothetical protein
MTLSPNPVLSVSIAITIQRHFFSLFHQIGLGMGRDLHVRNWINKGMELDLYPQRLI